MFPGASLSTWTRRFCAAQWHSEPGTQAQNRLDPDAASRLHLINQAGA
jgi:hypothetical protein